MVLKDYFAILSGNKWVILVTMVITIAVAAVGIYLTTPIYSATSVLRIASASSGSVNYSDYMYADRLMNTYVQIATSSPVLDELVRKLAISSPPSVSVQTIPNTELIRVSVEDPDPGLAQKAANTLAEILVVQGQTLYSGGGKSQQEILGEQLAEAESELKKARSEYETMLVASPSDVDRINAADRTVALREKTYSTLLADYEEARLSEALRANTITIVEQASFPAWPSKPRTALTLIVSALVGLAGGVGLAFLFEGLDARLYSTERIEAVTSLTTLGKIPVITNATLLQSKNGHSKPNATFREAFRRLRTNILTYPEINSGGEELRIILVTSAEPGEGKSTVTANLALSLAQSGKHVVIVDTDMRIPSIHKLFGLSNYVGLSSVLQQKAFLDEVTQDIANPCVKVITSGPMPQNSVELLASQEMKNVLIQLTQKYDVVLLDSPAFLAVTDASALVSQADGVLLIVRRFHIRASAVRETCKQLSELNASMLGVVVNGAETNGSYYYYQGR